MLRPKINIHDRVRSVLDSTSPPLSRSPSPIKNYEDFVSNCLGLIKYVDDHIPAAKVYRAVFDRHMALQRRMVLVSLVEGFERFLKELAIVCVDHLAPFAYDDRFETFTASGTDLAMHFEAASIGKAMCESDIWVTNRIINDRFRQVLKDFPFGDLWDFLFPTEKQNPVSERDSAQTLATLWQMRHTITHNLGEMTAADTAKFRFLVRRPVKAGNLLAPTANDIRFVSQFLLGLANHTNHRVGYRLVEILTQVHATDSKLITDLQSLADELSQLFVLNLTVAGQLGVST